MQEKRCGKKGTDPREVTTRSRSENFTAESLRKGGEVHSLALHMGRALGRARALSNTLLNKEASRGNLALAAKAIFRSQG